MPLSTYAANALLDHTFYGVPWASAPQAWWVQLHTGSPGNDGTLNVMPVAGRRQCSGWEPATAGWIRNTSDIQWASVAYVGPDVSITHFSIWSLQASGECITTGSLEGQNTAAPVFSSGDEFLLPAYLLFVQYAS